MLNTETRTTGREPLEIGFDEALRKNSFSLVYQPIVSIGEGRILGVEVLTRLTLHGEVVDPDVFIVRAEETGAIDSLTSWVIRRVGEDLDRVGLPPFWAIHVNVSPVQIMHSEGRFQLEQDIASFLCLHPRGLVLEVTENRFRIPKNAFGDLRKWMKDLDQTADIHWYLDDFGRGENFDALSLPIRGIKIDRDHSTHGSLLPLRTTESIARNFGFHCVAEGIETKEDLLRVRRAGITRFQGYLAWKPLPIEALRNLK